MAKDNDSKYDAILILGWFALMLLMLCAPYLYDEIKDGIKEYNQSRIEKQDRKGVEVKGANGVVYESYQSACSACDFEAAYAYLDKLQQKIATIETSNIRYSREKELRKGQQYVFKQECLYLVSLNTQQAAQRIAYLFASNSKDLEGEFGQELYDLAQTTGNEYVMQLFSKSNETQKSKK